MAGEALTYSMNRKAGRRVSGAGRVQHHSDLLSGPDVEMVWCLMPGKEF